MLDDTDRLEQPENHSENDKTESACDAAGRQAQFGLDPNGPLLLTRREASLIEWPTEQEIQGVSKQLARIQRVGLRSKTNGDYFKSGDLAYQLQETIRATADLSKKSQRAKG